MISTPEVSSAHQTVPEKGLELAPQKARKPVQKRTLPATPAAPVKAVSKVRAASKVAKSLSTAPTKSAKRAPSKAVKQIQPVKAVTTKSKAVAPSKTEAVQKAVVTTKPIKEKKNKVVRDSFTIPKNELLNIGELKKRAMGLGVAIKKSELIRAGLQSLSISNDAAFKKAMASVPIIKTGRPAKG